jgi:hypothetical protein
MTKSIYDLLASLDVSDSKAYVSQNIDHLEGKTSKKTGKVLKITQYTLDFTTDKKGKTTVKKDAEWIESSDTYSLTFRSREHAALKLDTPKQYRWLDSDVTPDMKATCDSIRGKLAMSEMLLDILDIKVKAQRKSANGQVSLDEDDIARLTESGSNYMVEAFAILAGNSKEAAVDTSF